ncbi:uncharacterized protein LOC106646417 [Copidosoma floridanum]|uniref:uncharacterized protein LOC106646417 n=1 Tax=Copidosoma floridanum TaxID=29053 RepID=UPI0006C98868|nr:uncharacterized protein LOC106646417 [Copidosoma floridanum]
MAEVELVEGDDFPRNFSEPLLQFRNDVINQKDHSDVYLYTKYHYEGMKRVGKLKRKYDSARIPNTPFTVVVSLPLYKDNNKDATYRVHAPKDVRRANFDKGEAPEKYFEGKNWRVHPDWLYCKSLRKGAHKLSIRTKQLKHSINKHYRSSMRNP